MTPHEKKALELPISEEASLPQLLEVREKKHFLEPFIVLARRKVFIVCITGLIAIASVVYTLMLPIYYAANARMMPPQQGQSFAAAMMDQLGGLGTLLGSMGGSSVLKNPSDLYVGMLKSRAVEDRIVQRFSLMSVYKKKLPGDARSQLESLTEIAANKDGTISVTVEDRDKEQAAKMANAYIEELEALTHRLAVTDASKRRVFFEREAQTASNELATAEEALKNTQLKTGIYQLDAQAKVMLEGYADLRAQITEKEIEAQAMRTYATPENPDLVRVEHELAALRSQLSRYEEGAGGRPLEDTALEKLPGRGLEYARKYREVKYREVLLQLLLKQYEAARIDEGRDAALIQPLDLAVPPEKRSRPHRTVVVISFTLLAFLLACGWVLLREAIERAKEDPQYLTRLQLLKFYLFRWRKTGSLGS